MPVRDRKDVRLFFALWPDDGLRDRLQQAAESISLTPGARRVPRANLHLTLHFIGNVHFADMDCLRRQARAVEAGAFRVRVDTQGVFRKARVAWLGCSEVADGLVELHARLGAQLRHCGYRPEKRAYNPHVTVARKLQQIEPLPAFEPIDWPVSGFVLVESRSVENGVQYLVVERYPLT